MGLTTVMEQTRSPRKVGIADHIWDAFDQMAQSMGSDRDALINQAMFMFARLNGFMEPSAGNGARGKAPPVLQPVSGGIARDSVARPSARAEDRPSMKLDEDPARREVAERVLETAAELERLIKGKNESREQAPVESPPEDHGGVAEPADAGEEGGLFLMAEGGELDRVVKDRFVIGRGKHCDFVINSGKVSREHAVILREGNEFFVEDLGSSNGTWFNKQRIKRRKIEDGDEYYICSEKVKFVVR